MTLAETERVIAVFDRAWWLREEWQTSAEPRTLSDVPIS